IVAKDGIDFFQKVFELTHQCYKEKISAEQLMDDFNDLLQSNSHIGFVKVLDGMQLPQNSKLIITQLSRHLVLDGDNEIGVRNLDFLFGENDNREINSLMSDRHDLIKKKIVEHGFSGGFMAPHKFSLTNAAKNKLLKGFKIPKSTDGNVDVNVTKFKDIIAKELFYNEDTARQIGELSDLLDRKKFRGVQNRMREHGRRSGFACLFFGTPGTGKTEGVLQIAKKTGRDIMVVDMSSIKSKYVGESEQNIKAVFDNYRTLCKQSEHTPILLFNEADAIFGARFENPERSSDKMCNTMQNIILQEMEVLDGILIATTNMDQSLDSAFERRFIYKIRFDRPDANQRKNIWMSMMPTLSNETALQLATEYDFSGGQIENIARKCDVESILYGEETIDAEKINRFCQEEGVMKRNNRIGFVR
ncbi:MAG: ATP-binding protein, partial [Muribaculaceae bacterium]|nr:ATP-binding protein [Muribaculaceae bacterium]